MNAENSLNQLPEGEKKARKKKDLTHLLDDSIRSTIYKEGRVISPEEYDAIKKDNIVSRIKEAAKAKVRGTGNGRDISDDQIHTEFTEKKILGRIEVFAYALRMERQLFIRRAYRLFPRLSEKISEKQLRIKISRLDENELSSISSSQVNFREYMQKNLEINPEILTQRYYDFRKIFNHTDLKSQSGELYKRLEKEVMLFERYGSTPSMALITDLFSFYKDGVKRREICEYFGISFSMRYALNNDLVDEDLPETIAKEEFSHIWNELEIDEQEKIIQNVRHDDTMEIPIERLNPSKLDAYFNNESIENILPQKLRDKILVLENTTAYAQSALYKIKPDGESNIHSNFLEEMEKKIGSKISNFSSWTKGMVLVFNDINNIPRYFKLIESDVSIGSLIIPGVKIASLAGGTNGSIGMEKGASEISYENLEEYIVKGVNIGEVISEEVLRARSTKVKNDAVKEGGIINLKEDEKIWDESQVESMNNIEAIEEAANRIDPNGEKINKGKIVPGIAFVSESEDEKKKFTYTIKEITPPEVTITSMAGDETVSIRTFIEGIERQGFRRVALIEPGKEDESFLKELGNFKIDTTNTHLKDGSLYTEIEENVDDGHGHISKEKHHTRYEFFQSKHGGHIRIGLIENGMVGFGEYASGSKLEDVQKAKKAKKLSKSDEKGLYTWRRMDYASFLEYLKTNDLEATTDNLIDPHANHKHEPHEHFEGSFFSKLGKSWSISDIMKGLHNLSHHIEHYFEKTSKLNASRFTLAVAKNLHLPADLIAQAQSEEVGSVKEIIEKLKEKLGNLNGPHGRTKALHIAHNKDARPEEVAAAMLHMVRGYGHLYAEDIAYAQGSYSFINGFLNACGFTTEAERAAWRQKSREKFKADMGSEPGVEPTEEEMIWGFMKTMDGKYEEYPLAGTVVKAMGGPSGWEKAWRTEGYDGAYQKGIRQGGDTVNADGRVNKGISSLITHEFVTAIGFMEKAAGKTPDPSYQTIPIIWALGGYSQYISTKISQEVKKYSDGMGHTLHAYAFLRNHESNLLFRKVFRKALVEVAGEGVAEEMDGYIDTVQRNGHHHESDNKKCEAAMKGLAAIWDKYQGKGLHDRIQGKNSWLIEKANEGDKDIKSYIEHLSDIHQMNSDDKAPPQDNDWMVQYGYDGSPLLGKKVFEDKTVLSLDRTLNKIHLGAQNFDMDKNTGPRLWPSVIRRVQEVKEVKEEGLKRAQYYQFREEIITWLRRTVVTRGNPESTLRDLEKKTYYKDLLKMGIDPRVIVMDGETSKLLEKTASEDYHAWVEGGRLIGMGSNSSISQIIDDTTGKVRKRTADYTTTPTGAENVAYGEARINQSHDGQGVNQFDGGDSEGGDV